MQNKYDYACKFIQSLGGFNNNGPNLSYYDAAVILEGISSIIQDNLAEIIFKQGEKSCQIKTVKALKEME